MKATMRMIMIINMIAPKAISSDLSKDIGVMMAMIAMATMAADAATIGIDKRARCMLSGMVFLSSAVGVKKDQMATLSSPMTDYGIA